MGSKWVKHRLGDIATFSYGKMPKKELLGSGKYVVFSGYKYLENYPEKNTSAGDLLVVARGVGGTGDVKIAIKDCYLTNLSIKINLDNSIIKNKYFYYLFLHNNLRYLDSGSAQSQITINDLANVELEIPSPETQDKIIGKLNLIDKKIVINSSINQTLEQMSQTLFKSWFVDFDPVIDNALDAGNAIPESLENRAELRQKVRSSAGFKPLPAEIRALFPSEFEETELSCVPKGWRITNFSTIAKQVKNNVKSEDIFSDARYIGLEHLERKHIFISNYGSGSDISSNKSAFNKNDVLFGKLRPYFHKVAISPFSGICSTDILVFRAKEKIYKSLIAMYAFTDDFVEYANLRSTGTRMPRAEAKDLLNYKIVLPGNDILEHFEILLADFWSKGQFNSYANEKLTSIRDTLLPRLISGELSLEDLPDLIKQTEAA